MHIFPLKKTFECINHGGAGDDDDAEHEYFEPFVGEDPNVDAEASEEKNDWLERELADIMELSGVHDSDILQKLRQELSEDVGDYLSDCEEVSTESVPATSVQRPKRGMVQLHVTFIN